ncbi:hypothetical protein ACQ4PT_050523 [Festuca glaucescens]
MALVLLPFLLILLPLPRDAAAALTRRDFPQGFIFGAGSSAYQDDVKLMHEMGLDAYRFSIAWPRLIPGIQPHVTIYHFDLPQSLQDEYNGLVSPRFIDDYTAYADTCFKCFGDRVKHWVTVNEPNIDTISGFDTGVLPPQRCSYPFGENCTGGNSTTEPYIAAHHLLLAHASAVSLYKDTYQAAQKGHIGLTLLGLWSEPATNTPQDAAAATRMNDFHIGWFMYPLVYGDYPPVMRRRVGARLPGLTVEQSKKVSGSFDFIGFNHYPNTRTRANENAFNLKQRDYYDDAAVIAGYGDIPQTPSKIEYDDDDRSEFLQNYLEVVYLSIQNGSNARGYFVWSFLDVFEFLYGNRRRYGLCGVDMNSKGRARYVRTSARWYSSFLRGGDLRPVSLSRKADSFHTPEDDLL